MYKHLLTSFFAIFIIYASNLQAQQCPTGGAAFINEFSGASIDEYIEIVVIGDPAAPLDMVDLDGWILDDNNIAQTGQGTASGHLVLGDCFNAMAPGSIIVVYNADFPHPGIDPGFPNGSGAYVIPHSDPCISICTTNPNTNDDNYMPCSSYGYEPWSDCLGLSTNGDGVQIRTPLAEFYHGLYYNTNFGPAAETGCLDVGNIQSSLNCGDWYEAGNYASLPPSPGMANSVLNGALIDAITAGTMECTDIDASCDLFVCPEIAAVTGPDGICSDILFDVLATGLSDMSFAANAEDNFGIEFVLFTGSTEPADPYSGGTSIGIVTYNELTGTDPDQEATLNTSLTDVGTFQICAILEPASANPDCVPYACKTIEVYPVPIAEMSGLVNFCPGDCNKVNAQITGGTEPYEVTLEITVGPFSLPFTIPAYDILDQPNICYTESGIIPSWDFATNTLNIPQLFTGSASITIFELVDANGCSPDDIIPNFLTINLNDSPNISSIPPIEICDEDNDGAGFFDLASYDSDLNGGGGGSIEWYEDEDGNNLISNTSNYYSASSTVYASIYDADCPSDTIPVELIVTPIAFAGEDAEVEICNEDNTFLDFELLVGGETGGEWTDESGSGVDLTDPTNVDFTGIESGSYLFTYTIEATNICPRAEAFLTVNVISPAQAGDDNEIGVCQGSPSLIDLTDLLGDNSTGFGIWTDVSGTGVDLSDPTAVDFSLINIGVYAFEYFIESDNECADQTATITVIIYEEPNPGTDNELSICNAGNTILDLEEALGSHDFAGIWVDENFSGVDLSDPFEVDFTDIPVGTYLYTYAIPESDGCPEASATITVEVFEALSAGQDSTINLCEGSSQFVDLFNILTGEADQSGTWSQLSGVTTDLSDPNNVGILNVEVGVDSFLYELETECGIDSALILFNILEGPSAGTDKFINTCPAPDTFNLNMILAEFDEGGIWYDGLYDLMENPDTVIINNSGIFNYYYIIPANSDCASDTSLVQINLADKPFAGADSSIFVCQGISWTQDLFVLIPGVFDSTGIWTQISGPPKDISTPDSVYFENSIAETDSFLYILNTTCGIDSAFAVINIDNAPSAGEDYVLELCSDFATINLYDSLGIFSPGGNWYDQDNQQISDPAAYQFTEPGNFTFTYVIPQNGSCLADTASAEFTIEFAPDAGEDASIIICEGIITDINLMNQLGGFPMIGGEWIDTGSSGIDLLNWQNVNFAGISVGNYELLYIMSASDPSICNSDTSSLNISIISAPNPGTDNYAAFCTDAPDLNIDLEALLSVHDSNGNWSDDLSVGVDLSDPENVDFSGIEPGLYPFTYSIPASGTCPADEAEIYIEIFPGVNAGTGMVLPLCEGYTDLIDLNSMLESDVSSNGIWTDLDQSSLDLSDPGKVDVSSLLSGIYQIQYFVEGSIACESDSAVYQLNILQAPSTGTCDTTLVCNGISGSTLNFDDLLTGNDSGGSYRELTSSGIDLSDPEAISFEGLPEGRYIFEYFFPASAGCPEQSTRIYIDVAATDEIIFERFICPDESFMIGLNTYDLNNPTGTEFLVNQSGCDSIIHIDLQPDTMEIVSIPTDANCFGEGSILIESVSSGTLPIIVENNQLGMFEVDMLPYLIESVDPGNYLLSFSDSRSCTDSDNIVIGDFSEYTIEMEEEVFIQSGGSHQIELVTDIIPESISWFPTSDLDCSDCLEPVASPDSDTEYVITIIDTEGCMVTDTIMIRVAIEKNLYVPNAFSPNNDELNQFFYAKCNTSDGYYTMRIYDRWGEKLYLGENLMLNQSAEGWDGTFNGKLLMPGVYIYMLEVTFNDGEKQTIGGDILLIR